MCPVHKKLRNCWFPSNKCKPSQAALAWRFGKIGNDKKSCCLCAPFVLPCRSQHSLSQHGLIYAHEVNKLPNYLFRHITKFWPSVTVIMSSSSDKQPTSSATTTPPMKRKKLNINQTVLAPDESSKIEQLYVKRDDGTFEPLERKFILRN